MRRLCPILVATVLLAGCKSDSEKLVDCRTDLRTTLDELYSAYGGSALAAQAKGEAQEPDRPDVARATAARLVGEMDRSYFEGFCLARGRGERPFEPLGQARRVHERSVEREGLQGRDKAPGADRGARGEGGAVTRFLAAFAPPTVCSCA